MSVDGLSEVEARLNRAIQEIQGATKQSIMDVSFDLLGKAVNLAPVDTGDLRGSGKAEFDVVGETITGTVSFNTPYALRQHEELNYNHPNGGQAKYLQQPFEENAEKYLNHIIDSARRHL